MTMRQPWFRNVMDSSANPRPITIQYNILYPYQEGLRKTFKNEEECTKWLAQNNSKISGLVWL